MKNICILYNGGSYGTFVAWALHYFPGAVDTMPFNNNGNSHKFQKNNLNNIANCKKFIHSTENFDIVRMHPKTEENTDIIDNLKFINENFNKVIYLIPTRDSIAWNINNKFEKIWDKGWLKHSEFLISDRFVGWNKSSIEQMDLWELREFLSLFIYPQHVSECELEKMQDIQKEFTKFKFVTIESLRDNFKDTLESLLAHCELTLLRSDQIEEIYQKWIDLQFHCHKDKIINNIIDSVVDHNKYYDWKEFKLTLLDEALVQYYLRQHNIEIKCYDLNTFPTNTDELKSYLDYIT